MEEPNLKPIVPKVYTPTAERVTEELKATGDKRLKAPPPAKTVSASWKKHFDGDADAATSVVENALKLLAALQDLVPCMYAVHELYSMAGDGGDYTLYDTLRDAVILAMARATGRHAKTIPQFEEVFAERLHGMSRAHDLLTQADWTSVPLRSLIKSEIDLFVAPERVEMQGVDCRVGEAAVVNLGLALHELATNSAKHGAWANGSGKVVIRWQLTETQFELSWLEQGGLPLKDNEPKGFGTAILAKIVPYALHGSSELTFAAEGFRYKLTIPASAVTCDDAHAP